MKVGQDSEDVEKTSLSLRSRGTTLKRRGRSRAKPLYKHEVASPIAIYLSGMVALLSTASNEKT